MGGASSPASGVILPVTTVEIEEGDTVFDVLAFVCEKYKIHMSYRGGTSSGLLCGWHQ